MKLIKYPSIEQLRNVVKQVQKNSAFVGLDESNDQIYDYTKSKPIIRFNGSTKAHGSNSAVCYNNVDGFWCQSRERILSIKSDNMGFCAWAIARKEWFINQIQALSTAHKLFIDLDTQTISIYGEFVGKGVQSGVAVSQLDKSMLIFGIKVSSIVDSEFVNYWLPINIISSSDNNIYNINDFGKWEIDIDFNYPELSVNQIVRYVEEVENCCPIGKYFGVNGVGEGIVWTSEDFMYTFKTKGELHSVSKVKSLVSVDEEKLNSINEFVDYVCTESRVQQFIQQVFGSKENFEHEKIGDFLRAFNGDILAEESDVLVANNLDWKSVSGAVSRQAKLMLFRIVL